MTQTAVATYFWRPDIGSKFAVPYTADDVRRLQRMVARNCTVPHQFVVITDQPEVFTGDSKIRAVPIDRATHVPGTCFVRLMTFHPQGRELFGADKLLQLDLDTLVVGNIDHLVTREEDLVLWRNPTRFPWPDLDADGRRAHVEQNFPELLPKLGDVDWRQSSIAYVENGAKTYIVNQLRTYYNTSVLLHRLGSLPHIHTGFDPQRPQAKDDQWLLSDIFGMDCPYFDGERDGVYRIARSDTPNSGIDGDLRNACIVTFPGSHGKPGDPAILAANPWIESHLA